MTTRPSPRSSAGRTFPRTYKGHLIRAWSGPYGQYPDRGEPRYYVQTQHATGIDWSAERCPAFWTLRAAKAWINERRRDRALYQP